MSTIRYPNTNPASGDSKNILLGKILQSIGGLASPGDSENDLLAKILSQFASGGSGSDDFQSDDFGGMEPDFEPSGSLGLAYDTSTKVIWLFLDGEWEKQSLVSPVNAAQAGTTRVPLGRKSAVDQLVFDLKQNSLYSDIVYLKVFGRDFQNADVSTTLKGPRVPQIGHTYADNTVWGLSRIVVGGTATEVTLPVALTSCTLFTAMVPGGYTDAGEYREIMGIASAGGWVQANYVLGYKDPGGNHVITSRGGSGTPLSTAPINNNPNIVNPEPRTFAYALSTAADTLTVSVDGVAETPVAYSHADPSGLTRVLMGSQIAGVNNPLRGIYTMQCVFSRALSSAEMTLLDKIVRRTLFPSVSTVFEGDSFVDYQVNGRPFWLDLRSQTEWGVGSGVSLGTGGDNLANILATQWPADLLPYRQIGEVQRSIVVLQAGLNDLKNFSVGAMPNSLVRTNLRALWAIAKGLGFEVVAVTITRNGGQRNDDVLLVNDMIRADYASGLVDYLVDLEPECVAYDPQYWLNPAFSTDGTHPDTVDSRAVVLSAFSKTGKLIFP